MHVLVLMVLGELLIFQGRVQEAKLFAGQQIYEHQAHGTNNTSFNVFNMTERKCSCKKYNVDKIPCVHALVADESATLSIVYLTHWYYHTTTFYNAYAKCIKARDAGTHVPEEVAYKVCKPPSI